MSDSDASSDECQEEKAVEEKPNIPINRKDLPRNLRVRYWHSWEEMLLVDLWRKHINEITCLDKNLPVFRNISLGMRESGFHINGQEVRRKIKTLKNKYIAERRRMTESEDSSAKSEWKLYPLVHCLMTPSEKVCDPLNEEKKLHTILDRIKSDPLYHILQSGMPVVSTLEKIESGEMINIPPPIHFEDSFPKENKKIASSIAFAYENKFKRTFTPRTQRPSEIAAARAKMLAAEARAANAENESQVTRSSSTAFAKTSKTHVMNKLRSILKRHATEDSIKQIRLENIQLVEECVIAKKRLKMEEQQLKAYEKIWEEIQAQYANLFNNLEVAPT